MSYEIEYGNRKSGSALRRKRISALIDAMRQAPFDLDAAYSAAEIRVDLEARGLLIGPMDILIAATALSRGALLVTNNTRAFGRVRDLHLAHWTQ